MRRAPADRPPAPRRGARLHGSEMRPARLPTNERRRCPPRARRALRGAELRSVLGVGRAQSRRLRPSTQTAQAPGPAPQPEQVAKLLNAAAAADEELAVFLWLAVTSGARRGELVALRWADVDLDCGLVRIGSSYVVRSGERRLKGTKTDDERWLSLDALTMQVLLTLKAARGDALAPVALRLPVDAFVFSPDPLGAQPWHPDHFTHAYRALADEVGIAEPLKNLRHFNACGCRELGHLTRPARIRVRGRRGDLVAAAERTLGRAAECGSPAGIDGVIGVDGACCSARGTPAVPRRGGAVR